MKVLVVGATGMVGGEVVKLLESTGHAVRAMVRKHSSPQTVESLRATASEIVVGDLRDNYAVQDAVDGMDAVVSTVSSMPFRWSPDNTIGDVDRDGTIRLIDASVGNRVKRFTFVSFPHGEEPGFPLGNAKEAVEEHLKKSDLIWTVLSSNLFMEVWLTPAFGFDWESQSPTIYGDGSNKISWVSYRDVARAAARSLTDDSSKRCTALVGGPEALSPLEVIEIFKRIDGLSWKPQFVSAEALSEQRVAATDEVQESVAMLQTAYAVAPLAMQPDKYLVKSDLATVEEYARGLLNVQRKKSCKRVSIRDWRSRVLRN